MHPPTLFPAPPCDSDQDPRTIPIRTGAHDTPTPGIPGYVLLERIGAGGVGVVYKACQRGLNRLVAVKLLTAASESDFVQRQRFLAEAEVVARLAHPNIVQIHEVGE